MNSEDRAAVPLPPPLIFFACLGIAGIVDYVFPIRSDNWPWMPRIIVGGILVIASGIIAAGAFRALIKNKTPIDPSKPTLRIVRDGSYRFSRNPMYLSLVMMFAGLTVLSCSLWLLLALFAFVYILSIVVVKREELYLSRKFGSEYAAYKASVRRWI